MEGSIKLDIKEVKTDLLRAINECSQRGLLHTAKWYVKLLNCKSNKGSYFIMKRLENVFFLAG